MFKLVLNIQAKRVYVITSSNSVPLAVLSGCAYTTSVAKLTRSQSRGVGEHGVPLNATSGPFVVAAESAQYMRRSTHLKTTYTIDKVNCSAVETVVFRMVSSDLWVQKYILPRDRDDPVPEYGLSGQLDTPGRVGSSLQASHLLPS